MAPETWTETMVAGAHAGGAVLQNVGLILGSEPARPWHHRPPGGRQLTNFYFFLI